MNKKWCIGLFAAAVTLVAPVLPAKADPIYVRYKSNYQTINTTTWTNVSMDGGTSNYYVPLSLTSSRRVVGRFTAESACYGGTGSYYCPVRIVYQNTATGAITEFYPQVGTDFAFDSNNNGAETASSWESHAISRSVVLPAGNYRVYVQGAVTGANVTLRLDDAQLEVELYSP